MFVQLQVTQFSSKLASIHANRIPRRPTIGPYLFWAMETTKWVNPTFKLLPECASRHGYGLAVIDGGNFFMNNRNWYGNAVTIAIRGLMGSTKSCPHVNNCDVSSPTEEGLVAIGGSNNDRGDDGGGGGGRFKKCRNSCDDSNYGHSDNNGQGDIGGGRGGGGGGETGDVEGNGGVETRWRWWWWDWGESCNSIFDRIATSLFYIIWNLKLGGIKIDGKLLETTVKGMLYPLVMPIFDMIVSMLPALLPAIITAAIPAILVTTVLAICYYHYWIVSAIVMSVFKLLLQGGLLVGSFLSFCLSLLG